MVAACFRSAEVLGQDLPDHGAILRHYICGNPSKHSRRRSRCSVCCCGEFWFDLLCLFPWSYLLNLVIEGSSNQIFIQNSVNLLLVSWWAFRFGANMIRPRIRASGIIRSYSTSPWLKALFTILALYLLGVFFELLAVIIFQFTWSIRQNCTSLDAEFSRFCSSFFFRCILASL